VGFGIKDLVAGGVVNCSGQALSGGDKISMGGSTARVGDIGIRPHDFEIQDDTLGLCAHQMALSQPLASATAGVQGMIWWS